MFFLPLAMLAGSLNAQISDTDISPKHPLPLGGYTARGEALCIEGGDKLHARTLVLNEGQEKVVICSVEMLTVPESLRDEVLKRLPSGIHLFLNATHTHCAPDSQMLNSRMTFKIPGIASFKRTELNDYADRIAAGINEALNGKAISVKPFIQEAQANLNHGRRPGAIPDKMAARVGSQSLGTLWTTYAAHGTFFDSDELKTRGDWPGALALRSEAPVLVGAIGDVSPESFGVTPQEKISHFVSSISLALSTSPKQELGSQLDWCEIAIPTPKPIAHPAFAKEYKAPDVVAQMIISKFAPPEVRVTVFRLGRLAVVGISGEPTAELGRQIRDFGRAQGFLETLVISHVNGWGGYMLSAPDYAKGGYEATLSFYGPHFSEAIVDTAKKAIKTLKEADAKRGAA